MNSHIVISEPKIVPKGDLIGLVGMYTCEVYIPEQKKSYPFYDKEISVVIDHANRFVYAYLQKKINRIEYLLNEKDIRKKLTEELE